MLEEIPHALAQVLLIVDQLTEASQTFVSALGAEVIEAGQDWLLKDLFQLWVHLGEAARDRLQDAANRGH